MSLFLNPFLGYISETVRGTLAQANIQTLASNPHLKASQQKREMTRKSY